MVHVKETASNLVLTGSNAELQKLSEAYRFRPPNYWRSPKWELYKKTDGDHGWDGFLYPLKVRGTMGLLARGHLDDLMTKSDVIGIRLDTSGTLNKPFIGMTIDDLPTDLVVSEYPDYPHQREIVLKWLQSCIGIGELTVSAGKTRAFCMVAAMLKRRLVKHFRVLYLVPTERLIRQAVKDARGFLPDWKISQFGGGKKEENDESEMVIATYAVVSRNLPDLKDWLRKFNVLLVDESHHAKSPTLEKIIIEVPAYFKLGATDSAKEDDPVAGLKIRGLLGPVLTTVRPGELIEQDHLAAPTIYVVDDKEWQDLYEDVPMNAEPNTPAWVRMANEWKKATYLGPSVERMEGGAPRLNKKGEEIQLPSSHRVLVNGVELDSESRWCLLERSYDKGIIQFKERNKLVFDWGKYFSGEGERTLVVATRTLHVLLLESGLSKVVDPSLVRALYGEHTSEERDEAFEWIKETPGAILISPLAKEGVSIPELTAGIVADYVGSIDLARQIVGRFIRKKRHRESNTAKIVWFIDRQIPSYRRGSLQLMRELEQIKGYEVVYPVLGPETASLGKLAKSLDFER
jgi:superfamily II DNA or RNA helicase